MGCGPGASPCTMWTVHVRPALGIGLVALCACGRLGFEPSGHYDAAHPDGDGLGPGPGPGGDGPRPNVPCEQLPGILYCDGFDGSSDLTTIEAAAPSFVTFDSQRAIRGQSLHARTTRAVEPAWRVGTVLPSLTSGELYVRWYHYYPSSSPAHTWASIHVISNTPPYPGIIFGATDNRVEVVASQNLDVHTSNVEIPRDRWFCLQMRIVISTAGTIESWIDGVPAARLDGVVTLPPQGAIENVHAGMFNALDAGPNDLWTDELAIGTLPIDC